MTESDFEGSRVLELLAEIDKVDEFMDAIDSDDFARAIRLMKQAKLDQATIDEVLRQVNEES